MELIAKHILIKGKVQGVFFRKTTKQIAGELKIKGWVKNTAEGDVEIFAIGSEKELVQFINWCKQGPPDAAVKTIEIKDSHPVPGISNFSIQY